MTKVDWNSYNGWYLIFKTTMKGTQLDLTTGRTCNVPAVILDMDLTIKEFLEHWNASAVNDNTPSALGLM